MKNKKQLLYLFVILWPLFLFGRDIHAQSSNDVIINEFTVNPTTQKEFVELLVTKPTGIDMRLWELTDLGSATSNSSNSEGTLRFKNRPFLSNLFFGCRVVVLTAAPRNIPNTFLEDTVAIIGVDSTIILLHPELGGTALDTVLNGTGTQSLFDISTAENIVLVNGPIASGTVVDYVATGTNTSISGWTAQGAVWSNNVTATGAQYAYFVNGVGGSLINDNGNIGWVGSNPHGTETMGALNPGQTLPSNNPPTVISSKIINPNTIRVIFSEPVDTSAENVNHYSGIPSIASAVRSLSLDTVILNLSQSMLSGKKYMLQITDIRDTQGLVMALPYTEILQYNNLTSGLVINELYYNSPGGGLDSLEFIELYNNTSSPINIGGIYFSHGVFDTLPDSVIVPGGYFVTAYYPNNFARYFGFTPHKWWSNNLANNGERVAIVNTLGDTIDALFYTPNAPWPANISDNNARSIGLIHPDWDNSNGANWRASAVRHPLFNGLPGWATPGQRNFVTPPALIEPANQLALTVATGSMDNLNFRWNTSTVPVGGSVYYILELKDSVNNATHVIYEGTDTSFAYSLANFADWLAMNNWPPNQVIQGIGWQVSAFDSLNNFYSERRQLFPTRLNQPPTQFSLIAPADGFRWAVSSDSQDSLIYQWSASTDPEGQTITYTIEYDTTLAMNSPMHGFQSTNTDTFYTGYAQMIYSSLTSLGLDSMDMYWRVLASDGNDQTLSNQTRKIRYVRILPPVTRFRADLAGYQEVPPTSSSATGSGYFELNPDSTSLFYRIYVSGLTGITSAHIHQGAAGTNGSALHTLNFVEDSAVGTWAIPSNAVNELLAGNLYVNVHTTVYPAGEIRGQIRTGTGTVALLPAIDLWANGLDNAIWLSWEDPYSLMKKTSRFENENFSRNKTRKSVLSVPSVMATDSVLLMGYNIYRSGDGAIYHYLDYTTATEYTDSNVAIGHTYYYFVSAVYREGQAPPTDTVHTYATTEFAFIEGFNDTTMTLSGALPAGWQKIDADGGDENPFWGEWRVMPSLNTYYQTYEGDGMMFINYQAANANGRIDEWLISPKLVISQSSFARFYFMVRAGGDIWLDSLQILISTTNANLASFVPIDSAEIPGYWTLFTYDLMDYGLQFGDSFYVAFRYLIYDGGSTGANSDMLMLDYVRIDATPITVKITDPIAGTPKNYKLHPNYPNPFNPSTIIRYELPASHKVTLKIYNTLGQEVRTLVDREQTAGLYSVQWDGKNNFGQPVSSGIYIYRLQAGSYTKSMKLMLIK